MNGSKKSVKELGYFIAKVRDNNLQFLINRFEEKLSKQTAMTIRFFDENPLSVRYARYNQGGTACYCMNGETQAKQKVQNKWQEIECKADCPYKLKNGPGRAMCNKEATLKFMLPEICNDKIWLMKITSNTAIEQLQDYIFFQQQLGNSLIGDYVIFLKEVEQTNLEGKKFKNKIVDIIKKEDFISNNQIIESNQIPQQNQEKISTNKSQNVENNTQISNNTATETSNITQMPKQEQKQENTETKQETVEKKTTKKTAKSKKEETKPISQETLKDTSKSEETKNDASKYDDCYMLTKTETKVLTKNGVPTEYLFAEFVDMKDKVYEVIIPPEYADELKECDLGTAVRLDLQTKGDKTFTKSVIFVEKYINKVAA